MDATRIDRWLWAVRAFKTRSLSTDACRGGHVRVNGASAKAATPVKVGDVIAFVGHDRVREFEIVEIIDKRVGASRAAECLIDRSPPLPDHDPLGPVFERERGAGRPTKRDRRELDRLRGN